MKLKNIPIVLKSLGLVLVLIFVSCNKSDDDATSNSIDNTTLFEEKVSTPIAPKTETSGNVWFMLAGRDIFYSNSSNGAAQQFMLKYSIATNNFTEVTKDVEICTCGYENKLISNGVNEIYYIANRAKKYSVETNTWMNLNYPASAYENNGETGQVYHSSKIYFLGGRLPSKKFKFFDTNTQTWSDAADFTHDITRSQMVSANNKIYVLGGRNVDGEIIKTFGVYDETANAWSYLADLPFELYASNLVHLVANYNNKFLLVLQDNNLHIYDIANNIWKESPLNLVIDDIDDAKNIFISGNDIYVTGMTSTGDLSLYKITLENLPN